MRRLSLVIGIVVATALACTDPSSLLPTTPSPPGVAALEITGPTSIAPGQVIQLVANVRLADGTVKQSAPSTPLNWFSSNTSVLRVTSSGVVTGQQVGDARITVFQGTGAQQRIASRDFVVVPEGTFRLVGQVSESDLPTIPVVGARVTVSPGSLSMVTGFDGRYQFYGVPPDAVVTVSKTGYSTVTQSIQLTTHTTRNFVLALTGTRITLGGLYSLTLEVAGSCNSSSPLSSSLRQRSYDATVTQSGPEITVALTEPRFRTNSIGKGNKFFGRATATELTLFLDAFDLYYYYYSQTYYPSVAERLSDNTILVTQGTVSTTSSGSIFSGTMPGSIVRWDSRFPAFNTTILTYCDSGAIRVTLTPR